MLNKSHSALDEPFKEAIEEVIDIAINNAAASLSEMTNEQVLLSMPGIGFVNHLEAAQIIDEKTKTDVSGVIQPFRGAFEGDAILLFPEKQSLQLVRAVLQQDNITLEDISAMEKEAMTEIGNVILNACLCSMADMFDQPILGGIPEFIQGSVRKVFSINNDKKHNRSPMLLLNMSFLIEKKSIQGYVTFLMDVDSVSKFKANIKAARGV